MIGGIVNSKLEGTIILEVSDSSGTSRQIEVVIDTGFNGFLTLPSSQITSMGLTWLCRQLGSLADGSKVFFDVHEAAVVWDGRTRAIEVGAADAQPLLGTAMLEGFDLRMAVIRGGAVAITQIP